MELPNILTIIDDETSHNIYNTFIKLCENDDMTIENIKRNLLMDYGDHYLVFYFVGERYFQKNEIEQAFRELDICMRMCKHPLIYTSYALMLFNHQYNRKGIQILKRGLKKYGKDLNLLNLYGIFNRYNKDITINIFSKILKEQDPEMLKNFKKSDIKKRLNITTNFFNRGYEMINRAIKLHDLQNRLISYDYIMNDYEHIDDYKKINEILNVDEKVMKKYPNHNKIRLGYLSADFRTHVCAFFIETLLKHADIEKFEIVCFSNVVKKDECTLRLFNYDVHFVDSHGCDPETVRRQIEYMEIDILIDLTVHGSGNKIDLFSRRCCPINVNYLGYPNTSGLVNMDYRICDYITDPLDTTQFYSEKLLRLNSCFINYSRHLNMNWDTVDISDKLYNDKIVFAVLNKKAKYNDAFLKCVEKIVNSVPNGILYIKDTPKVDKIKCNKKIIPFLNNREYFELFNEINVCLDSFPYNGTTTTCETLISGTPVITLGIKNRHVSNVSSSILTYMGNPELCCDTMDEYINKSIALGNDINKVREYKRELRDNFIKLMDPIKFMKEYENALIDCYNNHP